MSEETIWKVSVPITDVVTRELPEGFVPLAVQLQHGAPKLWVRVRPNAPTVPTTFRWHGTGRSPERLGDYIGTVQVEGGALVFHLFLEATHD